MCSRCRENLKYGNFTLSFGRLRQRIVLKCVPHVQHAQHDYFSSFNQSDHCFLAWSLPLPSSLFKLPITVTVTVISGFGTHIYETSWSFSKVLTNLLRLPAAVNKRGFTCRFNCNNSFFLYILSTHEYVNRAQTSLLEHLCRRETSRMPKKRAQNFHVLGRENLTARKNVS